MELKTIDHFLSVCKVADVSDIDLKADFYFIGKTDEELSLVCRTEDVPSKTIERDDGTENRNLSCLRHHGGCERVASRGTQFSDDLRTLFVCGRQLFACPFVNIVNAV